MVLMEKRRIYKYRPILLWILLSYIVTGCVCEICTDPDKLTTELMQQHIYAKAVPKAELKAGKFEQDVTVKDAASCLISCCEKELCNVAWYTHGNCFTIECDKNDKTACDPVIQTSKEFDGTLLIQVRSLDETNKVDECEVSNHGDCFPDQTCVVGDTGATRCVCLHGYTWKSPQSKECVKDDAVEDNSNITPEPKLDDSNQFTTKGSNSNNKTTTKPTTAPPKPMPRECEYGLFQCTGSPNQECYVSEGTKSNSGICQCKAGFVMGADEICNPSVEDKKNLGATTTRASWTDKTTQQPIVSTVSTTPKVQLLTVSAGDNKQIQLPDNEVTLKAFALPKENIDDAYHYMWTLVENPEGSEVGNMEGKNTDTLKLSHLIEGQYTFRVQVTGTIKFGEAFVNVTVLPPKRDNKPPVAKITPTELNIKLPNSAILDGSDSTDDDKIVSYHWEMVSGPLVENLVLEDNPILNLKQLAAGNYTFKLTVTDSDGSTNSTTANVTAIKEPDYPPKANAGSDMVIHLPQNSVILNGNLSTDDKGIDSYEWIKASSQYSADMQGTSTSELHLSHLEVGDYTFTLKVTDSAGQTNSADVHVYVKPEQNMPPKAVTVGTIEASLPLDNILLDGSNSTDDEKVVSFLWQQTGGPTLLEVKNADQDTAVAGGTIKVGVYEFKLTVKDKEGLKSSSTLTVNIKQVANEPPVSIAGGDVVIQLPQTLVTLDGSKSTDDHKITDYTWIRDAKSLAAGEVLNNSDHQAVLQLVNLVAGRYVFTLTVMDTEGLSSSDKASVVVKEDEHQTDLLELMLDTDLSHFTQENKNKLKGQLELLLPKSSGAGATVAHIQDVSEDTSTGKLRVLFYAMNVERDSKVYQNGQATLAVLKKKLMSSPYVLEFKVIGIATLVCQNNCSDHGHCDLKTKLCICEAFWTQNFFLYWIHGDSNCDWSILYVVIVCFIFVITLTSVVWACICCWQRRRCRCRLRNKKRHRYSLLQDMDDENDNIPLKKGVGGKIQKSSLMISESDFSSDEETIFVNQKKTNGHLAKLNGVSKQHLKTKLKT